MSEKLREDLLAIWRAGVDGVCVDRLMRDNVVLLSPEDERNIDKRDYSIGVGGVVGGEQYSLSGIDRIIVIGGGKASGGMAAKLFEVLEPISRRVEVSGWVNVPNDCVQPLGNIRLHASRPAGMNEPTEEAIAGTKEIIKIVESLTRFDLCFCLISGGGSALLPLPVSGVSLFDKCELTRFLSGAGATIQELNSVRKIISRIKGGGLKELCRGKRLISLILSDVLGDSLDVIASGLTVDNKSTAE
ncbi:MAG: glycerate-2-kinase family protein, partial [Planctomycetaceae bacterium]|nr:glycerate-2-kinase family protein [Planctomycetaceae bacterium]